MTKRQHGTRSRFNLGCRCDPCRIADREYKRAWAAARKGKEPESWEEYIARISEGREHGASSYSKRGCRCDTCREANRVRGVTWRQKVRGGPIPDHVHGTYGGYTNWGCRCVSCSLIARITMRKPRAEA